MHRLDNRGLQTEHHIRRQSTERKRIRAPIRGLCHRVRFRRRCGPKRIGVIAQSAKQRIVPGITSQRVVTRIPRQRIPQRVPGQRVIARATSDILKHIRRTQLQGAIGMHRLNGGCLQTERDDTSIKDCRFLRSIAMSMSWVAAG